MQASEIATSRVVLPELQRLEAKISLLATATRILPAITAQNAAVERERLYLALQAGEVPVPRFAYPGPRRDLPGPRFVDHLRQASRGLPGQRLYENKLDELELDVAILSALGDTRRLRPLTARRFGTGEEVVGTPHGEQRLSDWARMLVAGVAPEEEPRTVPATSRRGEPGLVQIIEALAERVGLDVKVHIEPNLAAAAATGDHTVYIAARSFGAREALRLAVHEVLGHLTSAANGRAQLLRLIEWGTAGSFADQEGVALWIEEDFGLLDAGRLRSLAGRVLVTADMHAGADFGQSAMSLHREHGFSAREAITLCERAHRGGGVARDVAYLLGYLRVREAVRSGAATLDELRMGRVAVSALPAIRDLGAQGLVRPGVFRPRLSRDLASFGPRLMPAPSGIPSVSTV